MRHAPLAVVLTMALTAPLTAVAHAAPPEPARPASVSPNDEEYCGASDNWHEGGGHIWMDQSDANDSLSVVVLDRKWLQLDWYDGDCTWYMWYHAQRGSIFLLDFCDQHGEEYFDRVSRRHFLNRVDASSEESVDFLYGRERDRGVFRVDTNWGWDDEPCEVRERRPGRPVPDRLLLH